MVVGIIDYGAGNLGSLRNACAYLGQDVCYVAEEQALLGCDKLILPGVGAFGKAMEQLKQQGLIYAIKRYVASGRYMLGVCLGMQLLFDKGYEFGIHEGLGLLAGEVIPFTHAPRIPHIGWNQCFLTQHTHPWLSNITWGDEAFLYFAHSYRATCDDALILSMCEYGEAFPVIVAKDNVLGIQPHPEKSHTLGLQILRNFLHL